MKRIRSLVSTFVIVMAVIPEPGIVRAEPGNVISDRCDRYVELQKQWEQCGNRSIWSKAGKELLTTSNYFRDAESAAGTSPSDTTRLSAGVGVLVNGSRSTARSGKKWNFMTNTTGGVVVSMVCIVGMQNAQIIHQWYVDNSVSSSGNGTSWTNAWKDFNNINWSLIKPGDTLYISGGAASQTYNQTLSVGASGTSGNPITIRVGQDSGHNGQVIISGASIQLANRNYITIDGSVGGVQKLEIKDNFDILNRENGWAIRADNTIGTVVKFCKITNCNNGIGLSYSRNYTVNDSIMRAIRGDVAIRGTLSSGSWDANKIFNNDIELYYNSKTPPGASGAYAGPDGIQPGDGTSIYNNKLKVVETTEYTSTQHPDTLQLAGSEIKVYGNEFINIGDSMIDYDAWAGGTIRNIWIYNNLFNQVDNIDLYPEYIRMYSTGDPINTFTGVKILNNTFVDSRATNQGNWATIYMPTAQWHGGSGSGTGNEIRNNIFLHTGDLAIDKNLPASITFSNNIYSRAQSIDPSGIVGTPQLDSNFVPLATDTLARNRGTNLSTYFTLDMLGDTRDSSWDIGAYEYIPGGGGSDTTVPTGR